MTRFSTIYYGLNGMLFNEYTGNPEPSEFDTTLQPRIMKELAISFEEWKEADKILLFRQRHKNRQSNPIHEVEEVNTFWKKATEIAKLLEKYVSMDTRITYEYLREIRYLLTEGRKLSKEELMKKEKKLELEITIELESRKVFQKQKEWDRAIELEVQKQIAKRKLEEQQRKFEAEVEAKLKEVEDAT